MHSFPIFFISPASCCHKFWELVSIFHVKSYVLSWILMGCIERNELLVFPDFRRSKLFRACSSALLDDLLWTHLILSSSSVCHSHVTTIIYHWAFLSSLPLPWNFSLLLMEHSYSLHSFVTLDLAFGIHDPGGTPHFWFIHTAEKYTIIRNALVAYGVIMWYGRRTGVSDRFAK